MSSENGWYGVDLDGCLAHYGEWEGPTHIGEPIPAMVDRVKHWLEKGIDVRIFTARVSGKPDYAVRYAIEQWCLKHIGQILPITCCKDYGLLVLFDDRCRQVELNTGRIIGL
jgi:hypothetical protein